MQGSFEVLERDYLSTARRKRLVILGFFLASLAVAFGSIFAIDFTGLTPDVVWDVLAAHLNGGSYGERYYDLIVWDMSVPRSILAVVAGAGLAVGGAVMQSLMRNPLADPYTTGVASGASFGAALFFVFGISLIPTDNYFMNVTANAVILSFVPTLAILAISHRKTITPTTMILAGIAIMYIFRAGTSLMSLIADPENLEQLFMWNVGTVGGARWDNIGQITAVVAGGSLLVMFLADRITVMTSGDRCARTMGVRTKLVRLAALVLIAVVTATIVGFTGTIGFMGLVAPHIARMLVGSNLRYLIPCSAAVGAFVLVVCDCISKFVSYGGMHVGVITAIIGGPVFIILLIKGAKKVWY